MDYHRILNIVSLCYIVGPCCLSMRYIKAAAAAAKSCQSCPTLCDPIDGSPPGSSVPGILQARTLEWVAISFPNAQKWKVKVKSLSRVWLLATPWTAAHQAPPSMGFSNLLISNSQSTPSLSPKNSQTQVYISAPLVTGSTNKTNSFGIALG